MLLTMRGSVCLYQGEELGLTEAELSFEDLVDPYGIEFWPEFKGRDGCRTPMVWQANAPMGGFTTAPRAWLPVPSDHLLKAPDVQEQQNDSLLHHYRATLSFRKQHPALVKGGIATARRARWRADVHPRKRRRETALRLQHDRERGDRAATRRA